MDAQVLVKDQARAGGGNVPIVIDGEDFLLKPTYAAAKAVSSLHGGIAGTISKIVQLDVDTIVAVITAGLGHTGNRPPPKDLAERVWRSGFSDDSGSIAERCVLFCRVLASGGRMPKETGDTGEANDENLDPR